MKQTFVVRPSILSELFTNLAAGWFALVIITPTALLTFSLDQTVTGFIKAITNGVICLLIAEIFSRLEVTV